MNNPVRVEITREAGAARVSLNGSVPVPLADYAVQPADDGGQALVSLVVPADMVSVGRSPASTPAAPAPEQPKAGVWGQSSRDPREDIPGWSNLSAQVAHDAEVRA